MGEAQCRRWHRLFEERGEEIDVLNHKHMCREIDHNKMQWLSDENTRLSLKCAAICAQIRKMKGRGKVTCEITKTHHF